MLTSIKYNPPKMCNDYIDYSKVFESKDFDRVYQPGDDTFFFLDVLYEEIADLEANFIHNKTIEIAEIGCGSGFLIVNLAIWLKHLKNAHLWATDINEDACRMTQKCSEYYKTPLINVINSDYLSPFEKQAKKLDVIICNPPYVCTTNEELEKFLDKTKSKGENLIDLSYAGGERGRKIIDKILLSVCNNLNEKGVFYFLCIKENNPEEIQKIMIENGFTAQLLAVKKFKNEIQYIIKFWKA